MSEIGAGISRTLSNPSTAWIKPQYQSLYNNKVTMPKCLLHCCTRSSASCNSDKTLIMKLEQGSALMYTGIVFP